MSDVTGEETADQRVQFANACLFWAYTFGQAKYDEADAIAMQLTASNAGVWVFQGLVMRAYDAFFQGRMHDARALLEEAEKHSSITEGLDADVRSLPTNPWSSMQGLRMLVDWYLGDPQGAAFRSDRMFEICRSLPEEGGPGVPVPLRGVFRDFLIAGSHAFHCLLLTLQLDLEGVRREARAERAVVQRHSAAAGGETVFANYDAMARLYDAHAEWVLGGRRATPDTIDAYELRLSEFRASGLAGASYFYGPLAEIHLSAGSPDLALTAVDRGIEHARTFGEGAFLAELLATRGQVLLATDTRAAHRDFEEAMTVADTQSTGPLQLRLATRLAVLDPGAYAPALNQLLDDCRGKVTGRELDAATVTLQRGGATTATLDPATPLPQMSRQSQS